MGQGGDKEKRKRNGGTGPSWLFLDGLKSLIIVSGAE